MYGVGTVGNYYRYSRYRVFVIRKSREESGFETFVDRDPGSSPGLAKPWQFYESAEFLRNSPN